MISALLAGAYPGQGGMGTGCISPVANFLQPFSQRGRPLVAQLGSGVCIAAIESI
jgi:hypothetical protein